MKLIKRLSPSLVGVVIGIFSYYFVTGKKFDWMLVGSLVVISVIITVIINSKLDYKQKSNN